MDWNAVRAEFPALAHWTCLNTATFGQLPLRATAAVARHWAARDETACWNFLDWFDDADRLRASLARLINAAPTDIAFIPGAAHGLALMLSGIHLGAGDNVVTLKDDFPNQLYLPQLREVPWEQFFSSIDERTRLIALSEVNYATGFRPPLTEISRFASARGIPLFVDGTQSAGALKIDLQATPVAMYAVHAYKWMISPNGAGFLYIAPGLRARLQPNVVGWRSHRDWRNVDNLHHGVPQFAEAAEKYESGGLPSALLYAMEASLELIHSIGAGVIESRVLRLADETRARLRGLGAQTRDTGSQIVAARFENGQYKGRDMPALARELKARRILVSARHGSLRVAPHFYNNEHDLECLEQALRELV